MADTSRKRDLADAVQLGGSVTAGTVGAAFGGSKLRDAFKEDYPRHFERGVARAARGMRRAGVPAKRVARVSETALRGKPGFIPFAAATGGGLAVAAGRHYSEHLDRVERRARRKAEQAQAAVRGAAQGVVKMGDPFELAKKKGGKAKAKAAAAAAAPAGGGGLKPRLRPVKPNPSMPQWPGALTSLRHVSPQNRPAHLAAILTGQRHMHTEHGLSHSLEHAARRFAAAHGPQVPKTHGRTAAIAAAAAGAGAGGALLVRRARRNDAQPSRFDYPPRDAFGVRRQ